MAATATGTDRAVKTGIGAGPRPRNGNGFHKNGGGNDTPFQFSPARYRIGVWMAIGSILMLFVALTSAYIHNQVRYSNLRAVRLRDRRLQGARRRRQEPGDAVTRGPEPPFRSAA